MSDAAVALIQGPWGSGKSTACAYKLLRNALEQPAGPDGVRHRRVYVVRNTFDELDRTTLKTWVGIFPEEKFGAVKRSRPFEHRIRLGGSPGLDWEVVFLALDREDDRKKLLSAEVSDFWFNEFREINRGLLDDARGRFRFPSVGDGGVRRPQLIGDTNAPADDHWFSIMSGQAPMPEGVSRDDVKRLTKPAGWEFFLQPPGLFEVKGVDGTVDGYRPNPAAENLRFLPPDYYMQSAIGQSRQWIRVNLMNRPGQSISGEPVYPEFSEAHVSAEVLQPMQGHPLMVGVDFGRTPAAVFGQRVFDRWLVLGELVGRNIGAKDFARLIRRYVGERFPGLALMLWGDPAGEHLAEAADISPFLMFREEGLMVMPAPSNDISVRVNAVKEVHQQLVDGRPRYQVSPSCTMLIAGKRGLYQYRRLQVRGERYSESPDKNRYSHVCDAEQYMMLGAGEGQMLLTGSKGGQVATFSAPVGVIARRGPTVLRGRGIMRRR